VYVHVTLSTAVEFTFRGARSLPGRIGEGAGPVSQDSLAEAFSHLPEHPDGISSELFVDFASKAAAGMLNCGNWLSKRGCWSGGLPIGPACAMLHTSENGARTEFEAAI
jgi:hypothetical protein